MLLRLPAPYRRTITVTGAVSLALTVGFLFLPLAGTDLSAQVARGHFVQAYGFDPVDFRWYGGVFPYGYSLLTGPLNALLGARGVGASGSVVGAVALAFLFVRTRVPRPLLGGVLGAICLVFNLVSGRMTFALGVAFGLLALCAVTLDQLGVRLRTALVVVLALLSSAASPVAGLFTGLCGVALLVTGRRRDGLALGVGATLPLLPLALLFRNGGVQPFDEGSAKLVIALCVAVVFLVPARYRVVRVGTVLAAVGLLVAFLVPSPVGFNAARLPLLFGIPVVAATAAISRPRLALVVAAMWWWQPPLVVGDWDNAGNRTAHRPFFQPLINELNKLGPVGRVEVVPLHDHWEATYVADAVPIARGWERQVDVNRNSLFYDETLTPATYLDWLDANAVSYVALPQDTRFDSWGREEAALVQAELPYLKEVWSNGDWELYAVQHGTPLVGQPGVLVRSGPTGVSFDVTEPGVVIVRVHWSRWLTLSGPAGCFARVGDWTMVRAEAVGRYRIGSGWHVAQSRRC